MDKIAVLIPCFNEELTIAKVIKDFRNVLPTATIYVYDNNSTDNTVSVVEKMMHDGDKFLILRHEYMQGKGNVIRRMFREIDSECYIMVDGDDTYPAENAPEMCDLVLSKNVDMVIGDRLSSTYYQENKRPFHNFGNALVKWTINHAFHCDINDIMTGYRAFSYQFAKSFPVLSQGFEIETEMSIFAVDKKMYLENVIIDYRDRPTGSESKLNTYSDGFKVLRTILRLFRDYKPLPFFGLISIILVLIAIIFVIPVLNAYFYTGFVDRFPTLIVCGFTVIAAIISLFVGLILHSLKNRELREFEFQLQLIQNRKEEILDRHE